MLLKHLQLFSAALTSSCDGGKVLVFPVDGSHWLHMKILVEALHSRCHQITLIRSSTSWYISEVSPYYTSIQWRSYQDFMTSFLKTSLEIRRKSSLWTFTEFYSNLFKMVHENHQIVTKLVSRIFENKTLIKELNETGYDLCLTDPAFPGGLQLANYLQLPLVYNVRWFFSGEAHLAIAPNPLSYVPALFSHNSDKMDFFQRIRNIFYHSILIYMHYYVASPCYQPLCDHYFGKDVELISLVQKADLWLVRVDFTFEFPRPTMPNVVYIGGFQGKPSKSLPSEFEEFVQSSGEHGVIVMTLGTLLSDLGPELTEIFASAFASLPQKVVWRHVGKRPATLGNNTMLVEWLPQNDLLGHPKTKVFVTHGVLAIPLIFDQYDNVVHMEARGVAEIVDNILDPEKPYKQNMLKLSQLHHDQPMKPLDTAVFWIEYVMRHKGAAHLRTEPYKLPWYAYHCLDVMAILVVFGLLIIALVWFSCQCLITFLLKTKKSKHE
uniref:Uncharacterized protein n=1 Tax=Oreochromis aureus TaxID=47969 RepID=A0A668W5Q7_OREAU